MTAPTSPTPSRGRMRVGIEPGTDSRRCVRGAGRAGSCKQPWMRWAPLSARSEERGDLIVRERSGDVTVHEH
eukprot:1700507-Rhodomonas_salina.2